MKNQAKYVTDFDLTRLKEVVKFSRDLGEKEESTTRTLENELNNAETVKHKNTPPDVINMNSEVVYKDMATRRKESLALVFPNHADSEMKKISVLSPIGRALLGRRVGEIIKLQVLAGMRRLKVEKIKYQPEAVGNFSI